MNTQEQEEIDANNVVKTKFMTMIGVIASILLTILFFIKSGSHSGMLSTIGVGILSVIVILIICFVIFIVVQINKKTAEQKSEEVEEKKPSEFFKSIRKFWYKYDGLIPMAVLMVACTAIIWVSTH